MGFGDAGGAKGNTCAINNVSTDLDKDTDGDGYPRASRVTLRRAG